MELVYIKPLHENKPINKNVELPFKGTKSSACADIKAMYKNWVFSYTSIEDFHTEKKEIVFPTLQDFISWCEDIESIEHICNIRLQGIVYHTGFSLQLPEGTKLNIYPRSSINKKDIRLSNSVGVIDEDYTGNTSNYEVRAFFSPLYELFARDITKVEDLICDLKLLRIYNTFDDVADIDKTDRICQICLEYVVETAYVLREVLEKETQRTGGFGSTGN